MANNIEPRSKDVFDYVSEGTNRNKSLIRELQIARLAKVWIRPDAYFNGYASAGGDEREFQYRMFAVDRLTFEGTLVAGTNNAHAFDLLPPFWPRIGNVHIIGTVLGAELTTARFDLHMDGEVWITYID